ncbi:MAG: TIGR00266 family protein [Thermaerobacter sp.]|nr:TIGR00266 family protein [Thermaerobacter sp.]
MQSNTVGTTLQVLEMTLNHGEALVAESGRLSWMSGMNLTTQAKGGMFGALRRAAGGGTIFLTDFTPSGEQGMVAFAARAPGQIVEVEVGNETEYLVHEHGFLCATPGIDLNIGFQRSLGAGVFGGTGFILQKLSGSAKAWIDLSGEVVRYDLQPGQQLLVQPGHVGMFEASVDFQITTMRGIRNMLFGGDGFFLAQLQGPGSVWLQSMPLPLLAHALQRYLPSSGS